MQEKNMGHICPIGRSGVKVILKVVVKRQQHTQSCSPTPLLWERLYLLCRVHAVPTSLLDL